MTSIPKRTLAPIALVTGAGTRVGRAIAEELGAAGMTLAIHYHRSKEGALALKDEFEGKGLVAECFSADLSQRSEARTLVDSVVRTLGGLDLLVCSAAIFEQVRFEQMSDADYDRMLELNLSSNIALAQRATPHLAVRGGSIVFITCSSVESPYRFYLPYVVSKAGLYQAMRALALELAPAIRVNAVAPGTVLPPDNMSETELELLRRRIPLQRFGSPLDIARAVRFLAESPFVTGQQLVIDGGRSLGRIPDGS